MQNFDEKRVREWECVPLLRYSYAIGDNVLWEVDADAIRLLNSQLETYPLTQIIALTGTTTNNQFMQAIFESYCSSVSSSNVAIWLWKEKETKEVHTPIRFWLTRRTPKEKGDANMLTENDQIKVLTLLMLLSSVFIYQLDGVCSIESFKKQLLPWLQQMPECCRIRSNTQEPQHVCM